MKLRLCTTFVVAFTVLLPIIATAQIFQIEATGEYVMGDNDSKIEARRIALEHAKIAAAEQAGTYIQSNTLVKDNVITKDEITSFASAILKTEILSEKFDLLGDKTNRLVLKIRASVDTSVLDSKIEELRGDTRRKEQLAKLQEDNNKLLLQLDNLSKQLNTHDVSTLKTLRAQRDELFRKIDNNNNAIQVTFARGTLLNLAMQSRNKFEEDKLNIDKLFQAVADNITVVLDEPKVIPTDNNDQYSLVIPFSYSANTDILTPIALQIFICNSDQYNRRTWDQGECYFSNKNNSDELNNYYKEKEVNIQISAGKYTKIFKVKTNYNDYLRLSGKGEFVAAVQPVDLDSITTFSAKVIVD